MDLQLRVAKLLHESDPILKKEPLTWVFNPPQADPHRMHNLMLENMVAHRGLGLSANQIGMPVKVFAMRVDDSDNAIVCFNPKITGESDEKVMMKEGCLSYPSLYLNVRRPAEVWVKYQNKDGDSKDGGEDKNNNETPGLKGKLALPRPPLFNKSTNDVTTPSKRVKSECRH